MAVLQLTPCTYCGGGDPGKVTAIKNLSVWVLHGTDDASVPISESEDMVAALKQAGGNVKFTRYQNTDHPGAWTKAYNDPELYTWLLAQKNRRSDKPAKV